MAPICQEGDNPIVDVVRDGHLSQLLREVRVPYSIESLAEVQRYEMYVLALS